MQIKETFEEKQKTERKIRYIYRILTLVSKVQTRVTTKGFSANVMMSLSLNTCCTYNGTIDNVDGAYTKILKFHSNISTLKHSGSNQGFSRFC